MKDKQFYVAALEEELAMRKPTVAQGGSQIMSLGVGEVMSTMSLVICRGVRNCPF